MKNIISLFAVFGMLTAASIASAEQITKPHEFKAGTPADASEVNATFDTVYDQVNKVGAAINIDPSNNVSIGTATPAARLNVKASTVAIDSYGPWLNYDPYSDPCLHCTDTCNNNDQLEFTCPGGQTMICDDVRNNTGDELQYRVVECQTPPKAALITGDVKVVGEVTGTGFVGDGTALTNVTATAIDINCPENFVLKKTPTGWQCTALCLNGDYVGCYTGPPGTRGVGDCAGGTRTCSNWIYGVCEGQVLPAPESCNDADDDCNGIVDDGQDGAQNCITYYVDQDDDGYGDPNETTVCYCWTFTGYDGYSTLGGDCLDTNNTVNPNASFQANSIPVTFPPDWDFNCDNQVEKEFQTVKTPNCYVAAHLNSFTCEGDGWNTSVPACGVTAPYTSCMFTTYPTDCDAAPTTKTQRCR